MHLPPQAAGPDRSHFSYNTQKQPPEKPRSSAEPKPQSPSLITEKRPRPGPKGRNRVAFNYECCNYIFIAVSLLAGSSQYTLVSGPHGPLTRRYAPTSGKPSSGPLRPRTEALSWLKAGMVWQGWGWVRGNLSISTGLRRASAVLLLYHMKQQSAAFHAADAAYPGNDI